MNEQSATVRLSELFRALGQPARLEILMAIGDGEACVCHLEAVLNVRQAYISQHLMALREAGILTARREGRFIFYRLKSSTLQPFIRMAAQVAGLPEDHIEFARHERPHTGCCCPQCAPVIPEDRIQVSFSGAQK